MAVNELSEFVEQISQVEYAMKTKNVSASKNSPLVDYALRGLEQCWLPEYGRWSHIYHLDNWSQPNESVPHSDIFYTLNVLLGLARVPQFREALTY